MKYKPGEEVEVRDREDKPWRKAIFLAEDITQHNPEYPYVVRLIRESLPTAFCHCRKPLPNLKVDDPVWVKGNQKISLKWIRRHFSHWEGNQMACWPNGRTSHTTIENDFATWPEWATEPPEEE